MRISLLAAWIAWPGMACAADMAAMHDTPSAFHAFRLETDAGNSREGTLSTWDLRGWVGNDTDKLWLRSEGDVVDGNARTAEFWGMYSRNVATFWDAQAGVRYDTKPVSTSYLTIGVEGLAPYFFETQAHLFLSNKGDLSARIREENDLLLTQSLIAQPYAEINLFAQDVREQQMGAGLATAQIGLQTRYEITRKFAPYVDVSYERKFGQTSSMAKSAGDPSDDFIASIGLRVMF